MGHGVISDNNHTPITIAQQITVRITVGHTRGSGTIIAKQNKRYTVITNAHVVSRGNKYTVITPDNKSYSTTLIKIGHSIEGNDLALLQFESLVNYPIAQWGNSKFLQIGESVYSAGFPFEVDKLNNSMGKITLLSPKPLKGGYQIGYSISTEQGMSGGPLLNAQGQLIGIIGLSELPILNEGYQYLDGTQPTEDSIAIMRNSSFAIPSATVIQFNQN